MSTKRKGRRVCVPVSMDPKLEAKIGAAAKSTQLSKQAVMRLSIERGLDVLVSQLTKDQPA